MGFSDNYKVGDRVRATETHVLYDEEILLAMEGEVLKVSRDVVTVQWECATWIPYHANTSHLIEKTTWHHTGRLSKVGKTAYSRINHWCRRSPYCKTDEHYAKEGQKGVVTKVKETICFVKWDNGAYGWYNRGVDSYCYTDDSDFVNDVCNCGGRPGHLKNGIHCRVGFS